MTGAGTAASSRAGRRSRIPLGYQQRHLTITAACATLLAALPLMTVFARWTWLVSAVLTIGVLCGVATLARSARLPLWAPTLAMAIAMPIVLAPQFPSQGELAGFIPTGETFRHFNELLLTAGKDMRRLSSPVADRESLLFLSAFGLASVAIIVDLCAVVLRRPAMAGLPMLAVYSVPVAIERDSVNMVPFALGALGFLWLLVVDSIDRVRRFGRRFSGDGRDIDLWEPSPLAAAGQRLGLVGVVLALVVPLTVPGMTVGLLERFGGVDGIGRSGVGGSGSGVQITAMLSGNLNRDRRFDMLKVQTNDPNPYYLRFAMADRLTPKGFTQGAVSGGRPVTSAPPAPTDAPGKKRSTYHASVEVVDLKSAYLPVYQYPTRFERIDRSWWYEPNASVVYSTKRQTSQKKRYSFEYARVDYDPAALRSAGAVLDSDPATRNTRYTPNVPEVKRLTERLTAGHTTEYDKVTAIFNHFSSDNGFRYALSTKPAEGGDDDIVNFLKTKQGYCVQYSAAMSWMVRAAGFPSRVAFGFTRGTAVAGQVATLTNHNLHAWTEVYFPGFGWVPFDPTPASSVSGSANPQWAPNPSRTQDERAPSSAAPSATAAPSSSANGSPGANQPDQHGGSGSAGSRSTTPASQWPFWAGLGLLAVLATLSVPALARRATRRGRLRSRDWPATAQAPPGGGDPGARAAGAGEPAVVGDPESSRALAHAVWAELLDTMTDFGIRIDQTETPRATAARLANGLPGGSAVLESARLLGQTEERARYARSPSPPADMVVALTAIRKAIRARATRRARVKALLMPPSVLLRWRAGLTATTGVITSSLVERGEAIARMVSVRRLLRRTARERVDARG